MNILSFSTLGCPEWTLDEIIRNAVEFGFRGLELRGLGSEIDVTRTPEFGPAGRAAALRKLVDAGLSVVCIGSSASASRGNVEHLCDNVLLARDLGCPLVRIWAGEIVSTAPHPLASLAARVREFGDIAQEAGVRLAIETHDSFSTGESCANLLEAVNHPAVGVLWDLHHPYRHHEAPEITYRYLRAHLLHIHVKDAVDDGALTLMGEGALPITRMLELALDGGYTGAISVEWEKRWIPSLPEPEIALPQYAEKLSAYLKSRDNR